MGFDVVTFRKDDSYIYFVFSACEKTGSYFVIN